MIQLPLRTRLVACVGGPTRPSVAEPPTLGAVDLAAVVDLAEVEHPEAPRATNLSENHAFVHERTSRTASKNLPRPVVVGHLPPVSVHARHGGPGLYTRAFILSRSKPSPTRPADASPLLGRPADARFLPDLGDRQHDEHMIDEQLGATAKNETPKTDTNAPTPTSTNGVSVEKPAADVYDFLNPYGDS